MDQVASRAAVSKQTLYKHFVDKEGLFTAIIVADIAATESLTRDMVAALGNSDDLEADLRTFARQHVTEVIQPWVIQLRRTVIAEAERFPELARNWSARGPEQAEAAFAEQFRRLTQRGLLRVDDPVLAAQQFNWLLLSIPLNKAMFHGSDTTFTAQELERYADEGVRVFLAAYRADG